MRGDYRASWDDCFGGGGWRGRQKWRWGSARKVIQVVRRELARMLVLDPNACVKLLETIDREIEADSTAGETTGVIALISGREIVGASVGDSEAWLISPRGAERLTSGQMRKPFLGSGVASPVAFRASFTEGSLLVGSDGLFKYTSEEKICAAVLEKDLKIAVDSLVRLVGLPSGTLPDDVGIALARRSD
ncbi:MAG: hypothetical protein JWQ71_4194 [Pedosphaera sp.]|nr:hypothetical protein [Pedosphaera sp.]